MGVKTRLMSSDLKTWSFFKNIKSEFNQKPELILQKGFQIRVQRTELL